MQDRPSAPDLLDAIADYLMKDLMPVIKGQDLLAYKALVSWNMLGVIARELREGEGLLDGELARLGDVLGGNGKLPNSLPAKQERVRELNLQLADKIRGDKIADPGDPVWGHVKQTLAENLAVANPRFNTD